MPFAGRTPHVLIVDDDHNQADMLKNLVELEGFRVTCSYRPQEALEIYASSKPDAVVSDYRMPGMTGLEFFERLAKDHGKPVFIIITAFGTLETAVEAMRAGVYDFVTKPVDVGELLLRLRKALHLHSLETENRHLRAAVDQLRGQVELVGASESMRSILESVEQVAQSQATVLLEGESGTGKELVARAIHYRSPRHSRPYIKVNCAAIPDNLLEAELFGHERGAFTGALAARKGKFELADGGTLLLDEVGDLPLHLQPKLLRVLQEREVEPLGAGGPRKVNVRVVAATHRDLMEMVQDATFREDLYYRLNVIPIRIPPLRERLEDVPALAQHFLRKFCEENTRKIAGFTRAAEDRLKTYSWPGNVRELENCIERAVVMSAKEVIDETDITLSGTSRKNDGALPLVLDALFDTALTLDDLERTIILTALERCGGNLSRAARILGMTRRALQYRVEKIRGEPEQ